METKQGKGLKSNKCHGSCARVEKIFVLCNWELEWNLIKQNHVKGMKCEIK